MENVILTIHLILALLLIGVVLLQRSEGGGLGMGGGGGGNGVMSGRAAATALTKLTWIFAAGFIVTSVTLTIIAARSADGGSVVDQFGGTAPAAQQPAAPLGSDLLPPTGTDAPLAPPRADQGTAPAEGTAPVEGTAPAAPAAPATNN
ncbi:preprotein translocase subunit SecG [Gemmobacter fulvus]|uniref:preprotein translocase subunit SecG n=1 Tax=Gemmobacter fulvus TaxID=2840474 RepID=UPI00279699DA|nr:preprotein translocase subunit SecG [Gemmobacter fulvus]MDQ1849404.1 preprotein translocase subunit SecG [Gemmobacter fulvus]